MRISFKTLGCRLNQAETASFAGQCEALGFTIVPKTSLMHKLYIGCINCVKHESPFTCPEQAMVRKVAK